MDNNLIRSGIILVAGLITIIFPEKVNKFQNFILEKFHIKKRLKYEKKSYYHLGIIFIIISIILFIYSIKII